ncbi:MAG: hypothetical protein ACE5F8_00430, partial [Woeseiaceae bacterium]
AHPGTWADSSLGCPEKGVQYAKVITPGFEVKILTDEATYVVHVAGKNAVMCERLTGRDRDPRSSRGEQTFEVLDQAKADLSKRAGIAPETMRIAGITRTHWASADFDCSTTGSDDPNGGLPGYIIRLSSGDDVHVYRADHFRIIYCGQ